MRLPVFLSVVCCSIALIFGVSVRSSDDKIKKLEIKGYITQVNGPTSFEIEDYKITLDGKFDVELQNIENKAIKFDPQVTKVNPIV